MKNRNLISFFLLLLSVFVVSGCNNTSSSQDVTATPTETKSSTESPENIENIPSPIPTFDIPMINLNCTSHLEMQWGSGPGELGYCPETSEGQRGPFPPVLNEQGEWFIFDRVNQRILRYFADLTSQTIPLPPSYVFPNDICAYSMRGQSNLSVSKDRVFLQFSEWNEMRLVDRLAVLSLAGEEERIVDLEPYYPLHILYLNSLIADRKGGVYLLLSPHIVYYDPNLRSEFISSGGLDEDLVVGWDDNLYTYSTKHDSLYNWGRDIRYYVHGETLGHISDLIDSTSIASPEYIRLLGADAQGRTYLKFSDQTGNSYILRVSASGDQRELATTTEDWPLPFLVGPDGALYGTTYSSRNSDPTVQPTIYKCEFE